MTRWIPDAAIRIIHSKLIKEHGGLVAPVNEEALSSTLMRPQNFELYSDKPVTLFDLAASYGFGFAKNHCFKDGNKRIALASIDVFLIMNGYELTASEHDTVLTIEALAASELDEINLAQWIKKNVQSFNI